ncbi:MAG TPA: SIMPL domain-containing protein, partial [Nitrolancea sp.]
MRSLTILVAISILALIPVGMGAASGRENDQASSTVTLELVISNASATDLGSDMQRFIDALRSDLGLTIDSAPSEGISIVPRLTVHGDVDGYVATNHLRFLC